MKKTLILVGLAPCWHHPSRPRPSLSRFAECRRHHDRSDDFRTALAAARGRANGSFGGLRREINWDGVPAAPTPEPAPGNFFNVNSPRGAVFSTPGTGFEVSANAGVAPIDFGNINGTYLGDFAAFSPQRLFTAIGSNVTDVTFFLPGTTTPATTSAFGAIFSDVDLTGSSLQFFDIFNNSLGIFAVPSLPGMRRSIPGRQFDSASSAASGSRQGTPRLRRGHRDGGPPGRDGRFLYAEPAAVPSRPRWFCSGAADRDGVFLRRGKVKVKKSEV